MFLRKHTDNKDESLRQSIEFEMYTVGGDTVLCSRAQNTQNRGFFHLNVSVYGWGILRSDEDAAIERLLTSPEVVQL